MLLFLLYFFPTIFAIIFCDKETAKTTFLINLLLGWSGIGWVIALIFAGIES